MPIRYKLTDQAGRTYLGFQWPLPDGETPGAWVETSGEGPLCGPGWLHFYDDPLLAALHNSIHANIPNPRLWKVEVAGEELRDGQMKNGWTRARLICELPLPKVTTTQRVAYGILCAREIAKDSKWLAWAEAWLSGTNRIRAAAEEAWRASWASATTSWTETAEAERAAAAASSQEDAADAARLAASASWAAQEASMADLDLLTLAKKALEYS